MVFLPFVTGPKPTKNKKELGRYYTKTKQFVRYAFYLDKIKNLPDWVIIAIDTIQNNNPNVKTIQDLITKLFGQDLSQEFVEAQEEFGGADEGAGGVN